MVIDADIPQTPTTNNNINKEANNDRMATVMNRIETLSFFNGFCYMNVCAEADVTDKEILEFCNKDNPSGTTLGWTHVTRLGEGKPVTCEDHKDRKHFLVRC